MRIYISGPMMGMPNHNIAAFNETAKRLRADGHFVINPAEMTHLFGTAEEVAESFRQFYLAGRNVFEADKRRDRQTRLAAAVMDIDLAALRTCDCIYLLTGWQSSRGACAELAEAIKADLDIRMEPHIIVSVNQNEGADA